MSKQLTIVCAAVLALGCLTVRSARAHFILVKPDSWVMEDQSALGGGDPQKSGPCGPAPGDTAPESGKVTTVNVGDTLHVEWQITIPHDGYFRISLAKDRSEFTEPHFADDVACTFDDMSVQTGAHDNVLMDGIDPGATGQDIIIPDMPCDECTLQVIQVMKDHGPPNCTYYHCANLKIVGGDGGGTGGMGGNAGAGAGSGGMGAAGMGATGTGGSTVPATSTGSGGTPAMTGTGGSTVPATSTGSGGAPGSGGTPAMTGSGGAPAMVGTGGTTVISEPSSKSDSGCAVSEPGARDTRTALWLAIGFGMVAMQRHIRRRR